MTVLLLLLAALTCSVLLAALVAVYLLDPVGDEPWGPEADEPLTVWLTDLGRAAVEQPGEFVLDERRETWGPA